MSENTTVAKPEETEISIAAILALGFLAANLINKANIKFTNSFLIQLFGSNALSLNISGSNITSLFMLVVVLGLVGWLYPVLTALKISPVKAMAGEK